MKTDLYKIISRLIPGTCIILLMIATAGCKKGNTPAPDQAQDGSTVKFVLNDNFTFGVAYGAFDKVNLLDTLTKPGPYTVLASDNGAFLLINVGYPLQTYSFQQFYGSSLRNTMQYCILDGKIGFKAIPLTENKPYKTHTGGNIYVSKYLDGIDTVITVNGLKVTSTDNPASNGLVQVLPQVMNPEIYLNASTYLHSDTTLSLFAAAMQRAGLDKSLLQGSDVYTLLAPSNTAFQASAKLGLNLGISTLDSITKADPTKLAAILNSHIIKGRYFDGDLFRYAKTNPAGITTLGNSKVIIGGTTGGFHTITFLGNGNNGIPSTIALPLSGNQTIHNANIPCGNAVVHIINRILIP